MNATINRLREQHQHVLARLAGLQTEVAGAHVLLAFLNEEVTEHFGLEERALFPVLSRHMSQAMGPLAVMEAEHREFRLLLRQLETAVASGDTEAQRVTADALTELLRLHIAKEDHVLFPMAEGMLAPAEWKEVDALAAPE